MELDWGAHIRPLLLLHSGVVLCFLQLVKGNLADVNVKQAKVSGNQNSNKGRKACVQRAFGTIQIVNTQQNKTVLPSQGVRTTHLYSMCVRKTRVNRQHQSSVGGPSHQSRSRSTSLAPFLMSLPAWTVISTALNIEQAKQNWANNFWDL